LQPFWLKSSFPEVSKPIPRNSPIHAGCALSAMTMLYEPPAYSASIAAPMWPQDMGFPSWPHEDATRHAFSNSAWPETWGNHWGRENPWTSESLHWQRQAPAPIPAPPSHPAPASHLSHSHFDGYDSWSDNSSSMDLLETGHHQFADSYDDYIEMLDSQPHQAISAVGQSLLALSLPEEPAQVLVVNSQSSGAYQLLCADARQADLVAFDAEWVPDYAWDSDNPISVLQLAFPISRRVYVLQLERLGRRLPQEVKMMLVNPGVRKVGFAVDQSDRAKMVRSDIAVTHDSITDVQAQCAAALGVGQGATSLSLRSAASKLLGFNFRKDKRITCSDWSIEELSPEQVRYAALDAWVTLRLSFQC